jgi:hypothetical protein
MMTPQGAANFVTFDNFQDQQGRQVFTFTLGAAKIGASALLAAVLALFTTL